MNENLQFLSDIYFVNNGEIDLLTGAMAPERFNQILARDLQLADRNLTQLSIIYAKLNIGMLLNNKFSNNQTQLDFNKMISDLEAELVRVGEILLRQWTLLQLQLAHLKLGALLIQFK